ncbi:MAG: squalene synthase HpnC [Ignavibacteria bacterium]|nr:squalene synthase HpnC [Ignavibacteria bacterium]
MTKSNYENFPVASYFIPKKKRKYIYSIYAFARTGDNIADSVYLKPQEKLGKLEQMAELLNDFDETMFKDDLHFRNIYTALLDTINTLHINKDDLLNLLKAFSQDCEKSRYDNWEELLEYSKYSANPVGRLVLQIFGYSYEKNKEMFILSDYVCTALQLANFWQDVSRDLKMNRIYIPFDEMKKCGYSIEQLLERIESDNFKKLIGKLVDDTYMLFQKGKPLTKMLKGRLRIEIKAIIAGGTAILKMIEKMNYKVLSRRVKISSYQKILIGVKAIF